MDFYERGRELYNKNDPHKLPQVKRLPPPQNKEYPKASKEKHKKPVKGREIRTFEFLGNIGSKKSRKKKKKRKKTKSKKKKI
tara:strand:- start:108 stop:353 length:246 start_codon:yes stop_codon:yes gene_type:complete